MDNNFLDSWAILAWLQGESAGEVVRDFIAWSQGDGAAGSRAKRGSWSGRSSSSTWSTSAKSSIFWGAVGANGKLGGR